MRYSFLSDVSLSWTERVRKAWAKTDKFVTHGLKANWNLEKWRIRRENKNFLTLREYNSEEGVRRKFLLDGTFYDMVSHHDIEYNFVFTPAASKARFASLARFWHTRARLCINQLTKIAWACAACCLDTDFNPGIAVHFLYSGLTGYDHQFVNLWNGCSHSEYLSLTKENKIDKFRSSRFGDCVNFPPHWGCSFNSLRNQLC